MSINYSIIIGGIITIIPIAIYFYQANKTLNKTKGILFSSLWGITSFIISTLIILIMKNDIEFIKLLLTVVFCSVINEWMMTGIINVKKLPKSLVIVFSFFLSSLFQLIPALIFSIDISKIGTITQTYLSLFSDCCFIILLLALYWKDLKADFLNFKKKYNEYLEVGFKGWIIGITVMIVSNLLIGIFSPQSTAANEQAIQSMINASPYITFICAALLAPFIEEVIFRKAFKDIFTSKWVFILLSGIIFGGLHVVLSFTSWYDLLYIIPYSSLGIAFAYIYYKTDNIFTSVAIHTIHNSLITGLSVLTAMVML